jgi:TatA/E family protein of Tat protein translocase
VFTGPQSPTPLIIVVVVLLLFGAKRIPELARDLGAGVREFKKGAGSEGETELEEAFDPHEERKTPLASSHAGLIHPSAWKKNSAKFTVAMSSRIAPPLYQSGWGRATFSLLPHP